MIWLQALRHPHSRGTGVVAQHVEHPGLRLVDHSQGLTTLTCKRGWNYKYTIYTIKLKKTRNDNNMNTSLW